MAIVSINDVLGGIDKGPCNFYIQVKLNKVTIN